MNDSTLVAPGVRFPEDAADEVQKQKQLLKDAAAFLVSCQVPLLVSGPGSSDFHDLIVFLDVGRF